MLFFIIFLVILFSFMIFFYFISNQGKQHNALKT